MDAKVNEWRPGPNVCRCCLTEGCYKDISTEYFWMGKREVYAEMLSETFDLTIAYSKSGGPNSNSRLICENCIARLRDATDFKRQVKECEKTFVQHLDPGNNVPADIELRLEPQDDKTVKLESVKLEKRHSDDDFDDRNDFATTLDDDDDDLDDEPLLKLASKTPKKETENVDILDLLDNAKVTEKRKSSTRSKEPPTKKLKKKEPLPKPSASKNLTTEKKKKALSSSNRYAASRENAEIILRNTSVYPFRLKVNNIVCVYCCDMFEDPTVFRSHMNDEHAAFNVATAFANLSKSEYVKVDILNLRCRICNVRTDTLIALATHLYRDHCAKLQMDAQLGVQQFLLEKNRWYCVICSKKVPSLYHLNRHTGTHYLNYICDSCGRSYITESGLAAHIKNTHGQVSKYSCRRCKKQFTSMEVKKHHLRTENYCQPFGCHMCSQRFLYWELRQKHLEMVHGKPKKIFSCADCGATFECRRLFHIHYKTSHTQDCYRCQCGQRFASKSAYEYHNVSHTGEKKFHCTVCGKMFSRKKNLNQHARIHEKDKRFACSACSHTFVQKRSLKSHMKVHHSDIITDFV